jgi:LEA14-like dessication related protein
MKSRMKSRMMRRMMRRMLNFMVAVLFLTVALGASSCSFFLKQIVEKPKVEFEHVDLKDVNGNGATVLVGLKIENPNSFSLHVDSVRYTLEIKGKPLTSSTIDKAVEVPGKGSAIVEIPVPVKFADLFSSVFDFLQSGTTQYRVSGDAKVGSFSIPFDQKGELKLKK